MIQFDDVLFADRTRIAWGADIIDSLFCQGFYVIFGNAKLAQSLVVEPLSLLT